MESLPQFLTDMYLHFTRLKARILPPETAAGTRFDARMEPVAAGVATAFDRALGRSIARASVTETVPGGWETYSLDRYPVEGDVTVTLQLARDGGTREIIPARVNRRAGLLHLTSPAGTRDDEVELSYTGGYYVDLSPAGDGTLPEGATAIPSDLIDAWVLQVDHECRVRKIFGGTSSEDLASPFDMDFDLLPRVTRVLRQYQRY